MTNRRGTFSQQTFAVESLLTVQEVLWGSFGNSFSEVDLDSSDSTATIWNSLGSTVSRFKLRTQRSGGGSGGSGAASAATAPAPTSSTTKKQDTDNDSKNAYEGFLISVKMGSIDETHAVKVLIEKLAISSNIVPKETALTAKVVQEHVTEVKAMFKSAA